MLTQARLKELLDYDPETGIFRWKVVEVKNQVSVGDIAGRLDSKGYRQLGVDRKVYRGHRLAFLYVNGVMPSDDEQVDHVNGIKDDNRFINLRLCNNSQNSMNVGLTKRNHTGIKGVSWDKETNKWRAKIDYNGKRYYLGRYEDKNDAAAAVAQGRIRLHGEFANHGMAPTQ